MALILELLFHSSPRRGGSMVGRMSSVSGLEWISSRPCRNPAGCSNSVGESEASSSAGGSLGVSVAGVVSAFSVTESSLLSSGSLFVTEADVHPFSFMLSLSFSDDGFVLVGVDSLSLAEPPLHPSSSPALPISPSAPRGFWCMRWCLTRLCFRVNVRSQV